MQIFPAAWAVPKGPGCFRATGFSSRLLPIAPSEGCGLSHSPDKQPQLIFLPPAPFVTQANFPGWFQTEKVCTIKASTYLPNTDALKRSTNAAERGKGPLQPLPFCCPNARRALGWAGVSPVLGTGPQPRRLGRSFALSSKS